MARKPAWKGYGQMMLLKALNVAVKVDIGKRNPLVFCILQFVFPCHWFFVTSLIPEF